MCWLWNIHSHSAHMDRLWGEFVSNSWHEELRLIFSLSRVGIEVGCFCLSVSVIVAVLICFSLCSLFHAACWCRVRTLGSLQALPPTPPSAPPLPLPPPSPLPLGGATLAQGRGHPLPLVLVAVTLVTRANLGDAFAQGHSPAAAAAGLSALQLLLSFNAITFQREGLGEGVVATQVLVLLSTPHLLSLSLPLLPHPRLPCTLPPGHHGPTWAAECHHGNGGGGRGPALALDPDHPSFDVSCGPWELLHFVALWRRRAEVQVVVALSLPWCVGCCWCVICAL